MSGLSLPRNRIWWSRAVVASALLAVVAGCGLPGEGSGHVIPADAVPYGLLSPSPEPRLTTSVVGPLVTTPSVFLLDGEDRLVAVPLTVDARGVEAVARQVLTDLEAGPSDAQRAAGLSSPLSPGVELDLRRVDQSTAEVEVALALRDPAADRLPLVVGQIVLSLTSIEGVDEVVLLRDGEPVETPLPGGARTTDPLTAADYATLVGSGQLPAPATPMPSPP